MGCLVLLLPVGAARADTLSDFLNSLNESSKALQENRPKDAVKHLDAAAALIRDVEPTYKDYIREAYHWVDEGKGDRALKAATTAVALNKKAGAAYAALGFIYWKMGNPNAGFDNLKKALDLKKTSASATDIWPKQAARDLLDVLVETKNLEIALKEFKRLTDDEPENVDYLRYLGLAYGAVADHWRATEALGKAIDKQPSDAGLHASFSASLKQSAGEQGCIDRYEAILRKHPVAAVQIWLATFYLDAGQKEKASPLLARAKNAEDLDFTIRDMLAKAFVKADNHQEAAVQFGRLLKTQLRENMKAGLLLDYGKSLVRANRPAEGIVALDQALVSYRLVTSNQQPLLPVFFELGIANRLAKRSNQAELYFREYLRVLEETTVNTQRIADDVKIAESLGDIYLEDRNFDKAAEVFQRAIELIKVLRESERVKYPRSHVQFKFVKALHGQAEWKKCIPAAEELLADPKYGQEARRVLVQACLEARPADPEKALEYLVQLKDNPDYYQLMGQALLASNRPQEALQPIEDAFRKQPENEQLTLLYAQVLKYLNQPDKAGALYQKLLGRNRRSIQAWIGSGDLEMQLAKSSDGNARLEHLKLALKNYQEARDLGRSEQPKLLPDVLDRLGQAQGDQAVTEAAMQAQNDRLRWILYTCGLLLAAVLTGGVMFYFYRRHWALKCFGEVCDLEADLIHVIRDRVQSRWHGSWDRLGDEPFRGRIDYKSLRSKAEREKARDILGVANFGHLVGIVDAGWEALGFKELCNPEVADPKDVIVANLSYVGSCRACLAHVGKLEELTGKQVGGGQMNERTLKTHLSKHLHGQVKTSLRIIRSRFRFKLAPEPVDLPVLTPLRPGSEKVRRPQ